MCYHENIIVNFISSLFCSYKKLYILFIGKVERKKKREREIERDIFHLGFTSQIQQTLKLGGRDSVT